MEWQQSGIPLKCVGVVEILSLEFRSTGRFCLTLCWVL
jgi:hypothetical protein